MKKVLTYVLSLALVMALTVAGTVAYLTDKDSETNVFTVGEVSIELNETFEQGSQLVPGKVIAKEASITNTGKNDAYVWMTIAVPKELASVIELNPEVDTDVWNKVTGTKTIDGIEYTTYTLLHKNVVKVGETTEKGLESVTLASNVYIENGQWYTATPNGKTPINWNSATNPQIYVSAYAIQNEGFSTVEAAYNAYYAQWGTLGEEFESSFELSPAKNQTELNDAAKTENALITLGQGTYTMPTNFANDVTLICEPGTVFEGTSGLNINGATVVGATFDGGNDSAAKATIDGTFKDCTFTGANGIRYSYAGETVVFENCVFDGSTYGVHFDGGSTEVIFRNCTISGFNAFAAALPNVTFEKCTFVGNGKSNYNGANLWGSAKMIGCEFTFDGTTANEWIDCIGTDKTYLFENCTVNGVAYTADNYTNYTEIFSRNGVTVTINGVECGL